MTIDQLPPAPKADGQIVSGLVLGIIGALGLLASTAAALIFPEHAPQLVGILFGNTVIMIDLLRGEKRSADLQRMMERMDGRLDQLLGVTDRAAHAEGLAQGIREEAARHDERPGSQPLPHPPH